MLRKTILVLLVISCTAAISAQEPKYSGFEGTAFHIPYSNYKLGYGKHVLTYDTISNFVWDSIVVSERNTDIAFPDVPKNTGFGIIFESDMLVDTAGCYEFSLNSDDGSLLWINDSLLIDNGGNHKMTDLRDTFLLKPGKFDIRIWYQQLYPTKYGFIYSSKYSGTKNSCTKKLKTQKIKFVLGDLLYFNTDSDQISATAGEKMDSIVNLVSEYDPVRVSILGHTDNVGDLESNEKLSLQRAQSVYNYLKNKLDLSTLELTIKGLADTSPIASNSTKSGRAKNRRVVIILE